MYVAFLFFFGVVVIAPSPEHMADDRGTLQHNLFPPVNLHCYHQVNDNYYTFMYRRSLTWQSVVRW